MKRLLRVLPWLLAAALALALVLPAHADEFRPAYLQLRQVGASEFDVLWKLPALDEATTLSLRPEFPADTRVVGPGRSQFAAGTAVQRWRIRSEGGLAGKTVGFSGGSLGRIDVLVRVERSDGSVQLGRVLPTQQGFLVAASPGTFEVVRTYTVLGVQHILTGFDHLLFVLALVLLVADTRRLLWTVTGFTIAHSLTLCAATLGWVRVPGPPVEAAIALSIVFLATELVRAREGRTGLTARSPWIVAFLFGLLHGLGFAGALAEIGLPQNAIPAALLFFNVGVEIGQVVFIGAVLAALATGRALLRRRPVPAREWLARVPAYAIGGTASFWMLQRVAAM